MVPPFEQTAPMQTPRVGTEGVDADINMAPPLKKHKQESGKDIRASSKGVNLKALSVAWKSTTEVLKVAAADRAEYEAEKASLAEQLKEQTELCEPLQKEKVLLREQFEKEKALQKNQFEKEAAAIKKELIQAYYFWGLSREDVDLVLVGKYSEIIFPGDDASPVAEQSLAPPVADDTTKELQCRYGKIKIERDEVLQKVSDRFIFLQKSLKDKRLVDESDKLEYQRSLLSSTLYFEVEADSERGLKEAYLELLTERGIVPDPAQGQRAMRLFFNIKKEDKRFQAKLKNDPRHARDELELCKDHNACLEMEKVEYNKLLQSSDERVALSKARLLDTQKSLQMSQSCLKKYLTPKRGKRTSKIDHELQITDVITFYGGELERVEIEFRCYILSCSKDVDVENNKVENMWFAKGNEGGEASTSKPRAKESEEEEVKDLLPHTRHKTHPQEVIIFNEPLQVDASSSRVQS
ncbi:hypothetical protein GIB67_008611 [Kingdonia uniflora]|uniref:Uncharacterized protein n=1 Tax=Kingdonia uniflora TaxID=39325 RepID=A0A7J7M502_9MAGN|nr:hypothetical protein GIB67_008611 [Kingdonia uniflora]